MRGRQLHDEKLEQNKNYLRKKIGVKEKHVDQYLTNGLLRGKIDEVLLLEDNSMAPLDYKFAAYKGKVYDTYKTQLFCYAWLIEENFYRSVTRGYIIYTRSKNKVVEVRIQNEDKEKIKTCSKNIYRIIDTNHFPKATQFKSRCVNCTYNNICIK